MEGVGFSFGFARKKVKVALVAKYADYDAL